MKKIYKYIVICVFALIGLMPDTARALPTTCDDGNSDCYLVITRTASSSKAWGSYMLEVKQEDYSYTLALYSTQGTDTLRLCTSYGKVIVNLWDMGSNKGGSDIGITIKDSVGTVLFDQFGFTVSMFSYISVLETEVCSSVSTCLPPTNLAADNITSTSADISFSSEASAWEYIISTETAYSDDEWVSTNTNSFSVSNLAVGTLYHLWVRTVCGNEVSSAVHTTFSTLCGDIISFPVFQNFENDGLDPRCWNYFERQKDYSQSFPRPVTWTFNSNMGSVYPHGTFSMVFNPELGNQSVYSPRINVETPVDVMFYAIGDNAFLEVGYLTDTAAGSTFHLVSSVIVKPAAEYKKYIVQFPEIDEPYYVVFRAPMNPMPGRIHLDDVSFVVQNPCPYPTGIVQDVSDLSSGQVSLTWSPNGGNKWQIAYGPTGFALADSGVRMLDIVELPAVVEGLSDDTTYDFYVRAVCDSSYSYWSTDAATLQPASYSLSPDRLVDTVTACGINIYDDGGSTGNYMSGHTYILTIRPDSDDNAVKLSGSVKLYTSNYLASTEYAYLYIFEGEDTNGVCLARYHSDKQPSDDNVDLISQLGAITLCFYEPLQSYATSDGFALKATCYDRPNCIAAYNFTFEGSNGQDAWFSWLPPENLPDAYRLTLYGLDSTEVLTKNIAPEANSDTLWSGLDENTDYRATLVSVCGSDNSLVRTVEFRTPCVIEKSVVVGDVEYPLNSYGSVFGYSSYGNGITQHIYSADELGGALDTVYGITLYVTGNNSGTYDFEVYMDTTSQLDYSEGGWIDVDTTAGLYSHRYFNGSHYFSEGTQTLWLDKPFVADPDKGIVVTFRNVSGEYRGEVMFVSQQMNWPAVKSMQADIYSSGIYDLWDNLPYTYVVDERPKMGFVAPCGDNSCAPVRFLTINSDKYSAEVSWAKGGDETAWKVEYRKESEDTWNTAATSTSVQSITLSGLQSGTNYEVCVTSLCDGSKKASRTKTFSTQCAAIAVPYTISFDDPFVMGTDEKDITNCWHRTGNESPYYTLPFIVNGAYGGNYCSRWYQSGDIFVPTLITPEIDADLSTLAVTFYYKVNNGVFEVGAASDPLDPSTYTPIDTFHLQMPTIMEWQTQEWQLGALDLTGYSGSDHYIYFRLMHDENSYYVDGVIDEIEIITKPDCDFLLGYAAVTDFTESSVTVSVLSDRFGHNAYNVYYSTTSGFDPGTAVKTSSTSPDITINGLNPGTTYYFWVEGDCGDGKVSNLIDAGSAKTWCMPVTVTRENPYVNDLEHETDVECMWQQQNQPEVSYWDYFNANTSPWYPVGIATQSGLGSYYLGDYDNTGVILVLPTFDFSGLDTLGEISFSNYQQSRAGYNGYDSLSVLYRLSANDAWTKVADIIPSLDVFTQQFVHLPESQGASFYQVAIKGVSGVPSNFSHACIDDITVGAATRCAPPAFTLSDITDRSVTVNWSGSAYDKQRIQYRSKGDWAWTGVFVEGNSGSIDLVPLEMHTAYQIRMSAVCDNEGYSPVSGMLNFSTTFCSNSISDYSYSPDEKDTTIRDCLFAVDYYGPDYLSTYMPAGHYNYSELLIDKSKLEGMTDISAFTFKADEASQGKYLQSIVIYMANSSVNELSEFNYGPDFTQVYAGSAFYNEAGEVMVVLDKPFTWDGSSNLIMGFYTQYPSVAYEQGAMYFGAHTTEPGKFIYARNYSSFLPQNAKYLSDDLKHLNNPFVPDIRLVGCVPQCYAPTVKSISATASSVTVGWFREKGMDVELSIRETGSATWLNTVTMKSTMGKSAYTFSGLSDRTQYDVRLRRDCSVDSLGYSEEVVVSISTDTLCAIPTALAASSVTAHSVTLSWSDSDVANQWEVHVWNDEFSQYTTVNTNPANIVGLTPGCTYNVRVRAFCPMSDNSVSAWSETHSFNNICQPASGLAAKITGKKAELTWTGSANRYLVSWGPATADPNEQMGHAVVEGTSYTISDLKSMTYTFRVVAECDNDWYSQAVEANATVVGIDEVDGVDARFSLRPNPASDRVVLSLDDAESTADVSILSVDGRTVIHLVVSGGVAEVNLADLSSGTYFVRVQTEGWLGVRKLVVR